MDLQKEHFWRHKDTVRQLLNSWTHSHQNKPGRELVVAWAIDFVGSQMRTEAQQITSAGILRSSNKTIGPEYLRSFKISSIKQTIQARCGTSVKVLMAMAGVDALCSTLTEAPLTAQNIVLLCIVVLLREFSQQNNLLQVIFSLYMYAAGLQRQAFEVLAHLGFLVSYSLLVSGLGTATSWKKQRRKKGSDEAPSADQAATKPKKEPFAGLLKTLSTECIQEVKTKVADGVPMGFVFDNINLMVWVAESSLGKIDAPMNGTCATAFELHDATDEALDQTKAHSAFLAASPLELQDILLSPVEKALHRRLMVHTMLRMVVDHGGDNFAQYRPLLESSQPATDCIITLHQSRTYPLTAMDIDESSIDGTLEVMDEIYATAGVDTTAEAFKERVQVVGGDLKSISNLRGGKESRAGHDNPEHSFSNVGFVTGLFHLLMAAMTGFLILHFGQATAGIHNPGSLHFHNKLLERKSIAINSPIPFTISKNLIYVSLAARVLHCLVLESGYATLTEYATGLSVKDARQDVNQPAKDPSKALRHSWNQLVADATKTYKKYTDVWAIEDLRKERRFAKPGEKAGDMVYENAILFMRDMLNLQELRFSIKRGDAGRILLALKVFALSFRGAGQKQYGHEILYLIHHIEKVWPRPLSNLILNNWLLNTTGHLDAWLGIDHHQEHSNLWTKTIYKAHGSNASWTWLAAISLKTVETKSKEHGCTFQFICLMDGTSSAIRAYNMSFKATQEAYRRPVVSKMTAHAMLPRNPSEVVASEDPVQVAQVADRDVQEVLDLETNAVDQDTDESDVGKNHLGSGAPICSGLRTS
ncbi:hypothetical protein BDV93DRAFT_514399 [Ceratobasidium sp. AG-I]|nr:hypothetical protein BDV93DRAFT_514399 [Ceratobasidium sp. AG-I]